MNLGRRSFLFLRTVTAGFAMVVLPLVAAAQHSFHWMTNYYAVTGASFREIRQSINAARPWKESFDGITQWTVEWNFNYAPVPAGCACSGFTTTTRIITTMPRWKPPAGVAPEVVEQWTRFFVALAQHEAGHAPHRRRRRRRRPADD